MVTTSSRVGINRSNTKCETHWYPRTIETGPFPPVSSTRWSTGDRCRVDVGMALLGSEVDAESARGRRDGRGCGWAVEVGGLKADLFLDPVEAVGVRTTV
jgi:hypothetical protein